MACWISESGRSNHGLIKRDAGLFHRPLDQRIEHERRRGDIPLLVGYLGLLLQGGCLLAIGTYISSCTRNQIVAAVGTFSVLLMLWVIDWVGSFEDSPLAKGAAYLSVTQHFDSFSKGVLDSKDILYYASMIFIGLFLTARSLESLRWRA